MESIQRVFFHELGHFVAHELNYKYYEGNGVAEMVIHPCEENINEHCGYCTPINNTNENKPAPIERLAQFLAATIHGCLFQAYFMEQSFEECMCLGGNGEGDTTQWSSILYIHRQNNQRFTSLEDAFFKKLVTQKALDGFKKLNVSDYIKDTKNQIHTFDVGKLREDTSAILEEYSSLYKELIALYNAEIRL